MEQEAAKIPSDLPTVERAFDGVLSLESHHMRGGDNGRDDDHGRPPKPPNAYVGLTYDKLDANEHINRVRSHKAGAIVVFIGTTRDNFEGKEVTKLEYTTYPALALRTLRQITESILKRFDGSVFAISIVHRLGIVPVGEDSIVIALSSAHRQEGWKAAEEALEEVKKKVEIWKKEWFVGGGVWRANRDGKAGNVAESEALGNI